MKYRKISTVRGQKLTGAITDAIYPAGVRCCSPNVLKGDLIWQTRNPSKTRSKIDTKTIGLQGSRDKNRSDFALTDWSSVRWLLTTLQSQLNC